LQYFSYLLDAEQTHLVMKNHREFEIPWFGLKEGIHEYRFQVTDKVIEELGHEHPDFDHLEASVVLKLDKHNGFLQLHFDIDGKMDVACDRCGDPFSMRLWDEFDLIVKFTGESEDDHNEEEDEADIVFVPRSETILDVSTWVYEFIMLSMPLQHIHPEKADGTSGCNPEALKLLNKMSGSEDAKRNLWSGLDKFKDLDTPEGKN
jgi:uncharacterized metal-binding protein YceD (DUF177 family)